MESIEKLIHNRNFNLLRSLISYDDAKSYLICHIKSASQTSPFYSFANRLFEFDVNAHDNYDSLHLKLKSSQYGSFVNISYEYELDDRIDLIATHLVHMIYYGTYLNDYIGKLMFNRNYDKILDIVGHNRYIFDQVYNLHRSCIFTFKTNSGQRIITDDFGTGIYMQLKFKQYTNQYIGIYCVSILDQDNILYEVECDDISHASLLELYTSYVWEKLHI